jgi:hypothetical protein
MRLSLPLLLASIGTAQALELTPEMSAFEAARYPVAITAIEESCKKRIGVRVAWDTFASSAPALETILLPKTLVFLTKAFEEICAKPSQRERVKAQIDGIVISHSGDAAEAKVSVENGSAHIEWNWNEGRSTSTQQTVDGVLRALEGAAPP